MTEAFDITETYALGYIGNQKEKQLEKRKSRQNKRNPSRKDLLAYPRRKRDYPSRFLSTFCY